MFGFDTGVISGALLFIKTDFGLDAFEQSSIVSVLLLGAMAGALLAGRVADKLGRRQALRFEGLAFLLGTSIAVASTGYWMLILARLVLGLAVGAASATVPVYLSEIAPTEIRGRVLTLNQLMITIGILIAYFVNLAFSGAEQWRAMFAVGGLPALAIVAGSLWMLPESPEWLIGRGRRDQAIAVIALVTDGATANRLVAQREHRRRQAQGERDQARQGWRVLLASRVRPALTVGLILAVIQQFGGINTIIYYAPTIIERTGLSASNAILYSIAIGIINLVMTLVAIRLVDRAGRRDLLLFSLSGMVVTLVLLGLALLANWRSGLVLVFMVAYIAAFAVGLGPVFWVLIGEIFPASSRAAGSAASTAANWSANFFVSLVFLSVVNAIGQGQTFWAFAVVCAVGLWFVARFVPETKDRNFEQVDVALQARFGHHSPPEGSKRHVP